MFIIDAQLSPHLATWLQSTFNVQVFSASYLGLRDAKDQEIFNYARRKNAIVISKDDDFVTLVNRLKSPPKVIWITCGNTTNKFLKDVFINKFEQALELLKDNDIVEITN